MNPALHAAVHSSGHNSRRVKELAGALRATIEAHRLRDPKLNDAEIQAALTLTSTAAQTKPALVVAILVSLFGIMAIAGMLLVGFTLTREGRDVPWTGFVIAMGVVTVAMALAWARARDE